MTTDVIGDLDLLGRCCFDSDQAGKEKPRRRFITRSFQNGEMSVDHLRDADTNRLTDLHSWEGRSRPTPQTFHGWYVFEARVVRLDGGDVRPDKTDENPWHANVICPHLAEGQDALDHFFKEIAENAHWRGREDLVPL